ncbi:transcription factor Spt20p [[Candida] jaroonii]|uniref:Transcription factor Spt20p n=1 Tax=[Candida] jaroonii TaxID=467808 RepID=A0ACA9Y8U3_9ASCO|nr:transcription factor Spt20p [[Candida] jaroonii]
MVETRISSAKIDQSNGPTATTESPPQRKLPKNYHFASTSEEILKKYSNYPPSLSFHIYPTHYKFNQETIPLDSPMIKHFLHHVLREEIPVEMSELIKDFAIKPYDGCLILQVYDHRNMVEIASAKDKEESGDTGSGGSISGSTTNTTDTTKGTNTTTTTNGTGTTNGTNGTTNNSTLKPKTYRTLLRPTQLSLYYDLLYHTDSALTRFTDQLAIQMESEIVNLTNRELDLSVPLNPYNDDLLTPEPLQKSWDEQTQDYKMLFTHRPETHREPRKVHSEEMILHKSSDYEEIMFLLSNKYKRTDDNERKLVVSGLDDKDSNTVSGQFMRLRFIEDIRKRKEAQKLSKDVTVAAASGVNTISQGPSPEKSKTIQPPVNVNNQPPNVNANVNVNANANAARLNNLKMQTLRAQQLQQQQLRQKMQGGVNQPQSQPQSQHQLPQQPPLQQQQQQQQQQLQQQQQQNMYKKQKVSPNPSSFYNQQSQPNQQMNQRPQRMQQLQQQLPVQNNFNQPNSPSQNSPVQNSNLPTAQSIRQAMTQQQQQLFNTLLSPQDQHVFKQLQHKVSALAMMGNTGLAPNKTQLTAEQQQQAVNQAKLIQSQLIQKFPNYFQRLKQIQLRSRQMLQQLQLQQNQGQQNQGQGNRSQPMMNNNMNMNMNMNSQNMNSQSMGGQSMGGMNSQNMNSQNMNSQNMNMNMNMQNNMAFSPNRRFKK